MAVSEKSVLLQSRDGEGNPVLFYPATMASVVVGLEARIDEALQLRLGDLDAILDEINGEVV